MKSFIVSLLLGPVVATNAASLRRLQFPGVGASAGASGGFMGGILADIASPNSDAPPAQARHCQDALAHSCDRTGASGPRDNFAYTYNPDAVVGERGDLAKAMQARMSGEGGAQAGPPALFAGAGTPPAGPPSPPWAQQTQEGEEPKLTVRQKFQAQFGMEVTADPYGVPAPDTPASPFGAAPASPLGGGAATSLFGGAPASPFGGAAEASPFAGMASSPFGGAEASASPFSGIGASLGAGAGANVGSLLRGGVAAQAVAPPQQQQQQATPQSQTRQTGNMTPEQRQRAQAIASASASASTSSRAAILPSASRY